MYVRGDRVTFSPLTADPSSCVAGDIWYRDDLGKAKFAIDTVVANAKVICDEHHEARHESGGADALPLANLPQPGDDTKITLGAGPDFSIRYDSTDDVYYVRDEVNGVDILKLVKNAAGAPIDLASHAARHKDGGNDELDASDLAGAVGSAGQFLKTDGAACSWADAPRAKQKTAGGKVTKVGETIIDSSDVDKGVMLVRVG